MGFICNQTFGGSEGYISAVAVGLPSESLPSGAVITGCQDGKIRIYNPEMSSPSSTLNGHTDTGLFLFLTTCNTKKCWILMCIIFLYY